LLPGVGSSARLLDALGAELVRIDARAALRRLHEALPVEKATVGRVAGSSGQACSAVARSGLRRARRAG
jgi:hypothetical protein